MCLSLNLTPSLMLKLVRNCPGGVQGNLNWMPGFLLFMEYACKVLTLSTGLFSILFVVSLFFPKSTFYTPPHFSGEVLCYTLRCLSVRPSVLTISDR